MKPVCLLVALLSLPVAACVSTPPHAMLANAAPIFSPQAFFSGDTVGEGTLKIDFSGTRHTHVVGHGYVEADGTLILEQKVKEGDRRVRTRTWHIRPEGDGRFLGTLSDAEGLVSAVARGNLLDIHYRMKGGLEAEQWLYLQAGGQIALNRMVVRKFGITIAALMETITRQ